MGKDVVPPELRRDEIHLWFAFYMEIEDQALLMRYRSLLSADERLQETRFHFVKDQHRYLVTRALVRTVLSGYADVQPQDWLFNRNAYGRPSVAKEHGFAARISFNLSHTENLILLGVTDGEALGVDAADMAVRRVPIELAERFFSAGEAATLRGLSIDLQPERFLQYWTLKEAYVKARGMGLSLALDRFSFDLDEVGDVRASFGPELCDSPGCWHFWLLQPAPGYLAAVCAQRIGSCAQRLVTRKIVPLSFDEPLNCTLLRQST